MIRKIHCQNCQIRLSTALADVLKLAVFSSLFFSVPALTEDVAGEISPDNIETEPSLEATSSSTQDLLRIRAQLEDLETRVDAYDPGIGELSLELGTHYIATGDYESALESFRRALHLSRINYGLTSEQQIPILEAIHQVYSESRQPAEAGHTLEKILLVYQENYDPWSPALADIYEEIGRWHLSAYYFQLDRQPIGHLLAANSALSNAHLIDRYQGTLGYDFDIYNLLAYTNYGLSTFYSDTSGASSRELQSLSYTSPNIGTVLSSSYRRGKAILQEGIKSAEETGDIENVVQATLMYADWNQLFNKRHSAREFYIDAYNIASELDEDNPVRKSFNLPHPLPNFDMGSFGFTPTESQKIDIDLIYNVSEWGMSSKVERWIDPERGKDENAEPIEYSGEEKAAYRSASRLVRSTLYRPAILNGQPMDFEGVRQTIVVSKN